MKIILDRDWKGYKTGRVLTPGDGVGNVLLRRGIASLVPPEKPKKVNKNANSRDNHTTDD